MKFLPALLILGLLGQTRGCTIGQGEINLARSGVATQSTDYTQQGIAEKAIDGNSDGIYYNGFCTHTQLDSPAWWRVDLQKVYKIKSVIIANRQDCCGERLLGAEVRVGNSPDNNNPVCGTVTDVSNTRNYFCCNGLEGRFVSVVNPSRAEYLTICEIEVHGEEVQPEINLAKSGVATQSTDYTQQGIAEKAIDGNSDGIYYNGFCTHTQLDSPAWWRVDLQKVYKIKSVIITNRQDCCGERLLGAEVRVGNSPDNNNPVCGTVTDVSNPRNYFYCNGLEGRFVSVVNPSRAEYLTICEIEVHGEEIEPDNKICL